jgi:hypothetical protein
MMTMKNLPLSARLIERIAGIIHAPGEPNHGEHASVEVWEAFIGHERKRALYLKMEYPSAEESNWRHVPYWMKRATGKNIKVLEATVEEIRPLIR